MAFQTEFSTFVILFLFALFVASTSTNNEVVEIDAMDRDKKWYKAFIVGLENDQAIVHFMGWDKKWDEKISFTSPRLRPRQEGTAVGPRGFESLIDIQLKYPFKTAQPDVRTLPVQAEALREVDAQDYSGKWYQAFLLTENEDEAFVHFNGWSSDWDEIVDKATRVINYLFMKNE
jgi:hypothetical protein